MTGVPKYGDSSYVLLAKVLKSLSDYYSEPTLAPNRLDSFNRLLFKLAKILELHA